MSHPRLLTAGLATLALIVAGPAAAATYTSVDTAHSKVGFSYQQMGVSLDGQFKTFSAGLNFDPAHPAAGHASLEVQLSGIDAGNAEANSELSDKTWFNTAKFPTAKFESTAIKALGGNRFQVDGTLTIKGHAHPVSTTATLTPSAGGADLEGAFDIKRTDYAIGEGEWADTSIVADPVSIHFKLHAVTGK